MTTATLGFAIDSSQALSAKDRLDQMSGASKRAEDASKALSRTFDAALKPIAAILQKVEQNTAKAASGISALGKSFSGTAQQTEEATRSFGHADLALQRMIDRISGVTRGTQQWHGPLANIGAEMDRLRAKFNPLFAASKRYETELDEINYAHRIGAISAREQAAALDALNARYKAAAMAARTFSKLNGQALNNSRQLSFQLIDIGQALATAPTMGIYALQNLGFQVAQIGQLYMGRGGFNQAIKDSARQVGAFASRLGSLAGAVGALGIVFAGATNEINRTSSAAVSMGDVMLAAVQVSWEAITNQLQPALNRLADWWDRFTPRLMANLKDSANAIVATFVGPYDAVVAVWGDLPSVFTDLGYQAAQGMLDAFASMARSSANIFNEMTLGIQSQLKKLGVYIDVPTVDAAIYAPQLNNTAAGAAGSAASAASDALKKAFETDYTGDFFGRIADRARELAAATDDVTSAAGKAADAWRGLRKVTGDTADKLRARVEGLGNSLGGIFRGLLDQTMTWKDAALNAIQSVFAFYNQQSMDRTGTGLGGSGLFGAITRGFLGLADGGVLQNGSVTPFARGGVVTRPTLFPMANGAGLMGEAGPEAIMPLKRGRDGRLGVAANNNQPSAANQSQQSVVRIELSDGLVAAILQEAGNQSVEIAKLSGKASVRESVAAVGNKLRKSPGYARG